MACVAQTLKHTAEFRLMLFKIDSSYPPHIPHAGHYGPPKGQCNQHRNAHEKGYARQDVSLPPENVNIPKKML